VDAVRLRPRPTTPLDIHVILREVGYMYFHAWLIVTTLYDYPAIAGLLCTRDMLTQRKKDTTLVT